MEQCYGWPLSTFVHPEDVGPVAERVAQMTDEGQVFEHGEVRVVALDGSVVVTDVTRVRTSWGGEPAFQVILRDISERIAAEAAVRYRASLVAHVSDAIIGIDADGKIESWNEAAAAIYGWTEHEVVGRSISEILTGFRTDSAVGPRARAAVPRPQGRSAGRGAGLDRPADRRRRAAGRAGWWCAPS